MVDFKKELDILLAGENDMLVADEFELLANESKRILTAIDRKQADVSLQIEEIFDIVQQSGKYMGELRSERLRMEQMRDAVIGLSDMIEDFLHFADKSGNGNLANQARMMHKNAGALLDKCAISRVGEAGQPLAPDLHSVRAAEPSSYPHEHIKSVLQSGYRYMGTMIRKATVIVSTGEAAKKINKDTKEKESKTENIKEYNSRVNRFSRFLKGLVNK